MDSHVKALVYLGPEKLEVQERPVPVPSPRQTLVRIRSAGICGTEHSILSGTRSGPLSFRAVVVLGTRVYAQGDFQRAVSIAAEVGPTPRRLQSEPFTLEVGETAFSRSRGGADVMRVLFAVD
jgi:hypothetical protein